MTITNLKSSPPLLASTLSLIEKAFQYEKGHHFDVDFAPLMDESNHENCFVKLNTEGNVIAHIGFCKRTLGGHPIGMLGGIAVDERYRGEGYFQELMQEIISEHRGNVAFFLLWSDQEKLYKKFGFYLCGAQIELPQTGQKKEFKKDPLIFFLLNILVLLILSQIYTNFSFFRFHIILLIVPFSLLGK
jgi:predicted N-acetyltransferase YhbS